MRASNSVRSRARAWRAARALAAAAARSALMADASRLSIMATASPAATGSPKRLLIRVIAPSARAARIAAPWGMATTVAWAGTAASRPPSARTSTWTPSAAIRSGGMSTRGFSSA